MRFMMVFLAIGALMIVGLGITFISIERNVTEKPAVEQVQHEHMASFEREGPSLDGMTDELIGGEEVAVERERELTHEVIAHSGNYWLITEGGNVRAGPGTGYAVIDEVEPSVKLSAFEKAEIEGMVWYHVAFNVHKSGWVSSLIVQPMPNLLDVPLINQYPELPTGCEVTSLAMALQYYGIEVDKLTLANEMMVDDVPIIRAADRTILQWGDPEVGFVGDPSALGITINPNPLKQLADQYRPSIALYDEPFSVIEQHIWDGKPTIVWFTLHYEMPVHRTWVTDEQKEVFAPTPLHTVTVTGVDERYVYFNDSDADEKHIKVEKDQFIQVYDAMGRRALVVE